MLFSIDMFCIVLLVLLYELIFLSFLAFSVSFTEPTSETFCSKVYIEVALHI